MTEEKLWLLVSLQFSGEATPAELEELQQLLQQDSRAAERAAAWQEMWKARYEPASGNVAAMPFDKHLQRLSNQLGAPVLQFDDEPAENNAEVLLQKKSRRKWWWMASSAAACLVIALLLLRPDQKSNGPVVKTAGNTVSTKPGSKSKIELPDGTQVWLNADSKLEYSGDFTGKLREVSLSGEAYFDVVKDKSRPFIIHTSKVRIKVLGTAFNVRSYPGDKTTETALIRGSVEVTLNRTPDKKVILKPNEKVIIDNDPVGTVAGTQLRKADSTTDNMIVKNVHVDKKDQEVYETMWVKNKLAFDETPFDNMIAEVERWYNVEIVVKNDRLSKGVYTFTFENKSLDEVLEGLQFSAHFQYQRKDGIVTIW